MKKALLWSIEGEKIRCNLCARLCLIPNGIKGFCQTRKNIDGVLYATMYGEISMSVLILLRKNRFFIFIQEVKASQYQQLDVHFDASSVKTMIFHKNSSK